MKGQQDIFFTMKKEDQQEIRKGFKTENLQNAKAVLVWPSHSGSRNNVGPWNSNLPGNIFHLPANCAICSHLVLVTILSSHWSPWPGPTL